MNENPTASSLERAHNCPASCVLPGADVTTDDSTRGNNGHSFVSRVIGGMPRAAALEQVPEELRATCTGIDFRKLVGDLTSVRAEVAYAYDTKTRTARELGVNIGRKYPPTSATEIAGTLDIEGNREDGVPCVPDLKFGFGDVTHPRENFQTLFFGLVRSTIKRTDEAEARILRIRANGEVILTSHVFGRFDLDEYADALEEIVAGVAEARRAYLENGLTRVHAGPWCTYCPAFASCPRKQLLVRQMLPELQALAGPDAAAIDGRIQAMSVVDAGRAWSKYKEIKTVFEAVEESLKARAKREALPLANGKEAALSSYSQASFSKVRAMELLRIRGATDEEIASCNVERTVEKVIEKKAAKERAA